MSSIFQKCKCIYCKKYNNFPILWELSSGVLWFEIPKNGSSTIKHRFKDRTHITDFSTTKERTPLVVLRDPVDRFISLFKHYFLEEERRFTRGENICRRMNKNIALLNVEERLTFLIDNLNNLTTEEEVHHFYPQVSFIDTINFSDFTLVNLCDLSDVIPSEHLNSTTTNVNVELSNNQKQLVEDIYKYDYDFFDKHKFQVK